MSSMSSKPPRGPRNGRDRDHSNTRTVSSGGIQKNRGPPVRVDQDGDLVMDAAGGRGRGRGGRGHGPRHDPTISNGRGGRLGRGGLDSSAAQKAILRGMNTGNLIIRQPKGNLVAAGAFREASGRERTHARNDGMDEVGISGWKESKAASNPDGGVRALIEFLERKAIAPVSQPFRIRKSRTEGGVLVVSIKPQDTLSVLKLNHFGFAGATLGIELEKAAKDADAGTSTSIQQSETSIELKRKMTAMLNRRYSSEAKLLDLSTLGTDPEFADLGMFDTHSRQSKFFPALMKVCDSIFSSAQQKRDAVTSISLASNTLSNVASVTTLAQTFPDLKNLDLSNNKLQDLKAIEAWRWKFRHLEQLVLNGNPLETDLPKDQDDIMKWYPRLRTLNGIQVRSDEEINSAIRGLLPIPTLSPSFRDEASIGENFIKHFFPAYDTDRTALSNAYYDAQSSFSLSVNTSASRAPDAPTQINWDEYIRKSRNLLKINHASARISRSHKGTEDILGVWLSLPATRHPDLLAEPQKWCVECHSVPGLPDPAGQSSSGVGGLIIMVHGEFSEVNHATQSGDSVIRSFDRTFVLGPGAGPGGVRVISDILVLRAYGGSAAWIPDGGDPIQTQPQPQLSQPQAQVGLQPGLPNPEFGLAVPGKSDEQVQKELMAMEMSRATGMTIEYSGMCLEQSGWNLEEAARIYESAKASLPAEAFM